MAKTVEGTDYADQQPLSVSLVSAIKQQRLPFLLDTAVSCPHVHRHCCRLLQTMLEVVVEHRRPMRQLALSPFTRYGIPSGIHHCARLLGLYFFGFDCWRVPLTLSLLASPPLFRDSSTASAEGIVKATLPSAAEAVEHVLSPSPLLSVSSSSSITS